jgi:cation-transporting ATPase 13A3/4/5
MSSLNKNEKKCDNNDKNIIIVNVRHNLNEIKLIQRTIVNNTHEVLEDKRIKSITSWRKSKKKFYKNLIFNILSLGILHLISLHYPYLYIKLYCNPWPAKECDFFLVENIYGQYTLCVKKYKKSKTNDFSINSDLIEKKAISSSIIIENKSKYSIVKNLTYIFKYNSMNYEYNLDTNEIIPVYMNLSTMTNREIIEYFSEGLSDQKIVLKFEERFGKNEYCINQNLLNLYFKKAEAPFYIIILLFGISELVFKDYVSFTIKIIFILFIFFVQFLSSWNIAYKNYNNEITLDGRNKIKVKRKNLIDVQSTFYKEINNRDLLPGDIIYLKLNDIVPCDCLIIEGECLINQANLNGDIGIFKKISLIDNNEQFNYQNNQINILLHGMKIIKIFSKIKEGYISVLCINTGPNTYKANLYSNILYSKMKKGHQNFYGFFGDDRKKMFIVIIILFIVSILLGFAYIHVLKMKMFLEVLKNLIPSCFALSLFKSFMPVYFIAHSIILISNLYDLKQQNIFCFDKCRLLHAYNIETIFFSKANILCENTLEICSYNPININIQKHGIINFRTYKEDQGKELNIQLLKYYNDYIFNEIYQYNKNEKTKRENGDSLILKDCKITESKLNIEAYHYTALLLECLLSCNNLEKINNEIFGNTIEVKIFNNFKWDMKTYDSNYYEEENKNNEKNGNNNIFCELKREKTKYDFDNDSNLVDKKISDIFPSNYYKITETVEKTKSQNNWKKLKTKYFNNFNLKKNEMSNGNLKAQNNINRNPILENLSKTDINSYKLRIYKRYIAMQNEIILLSGKFFFFC